MRNPFIELHECRVGDEENRFGSGWEDLFTDQLGFFLSCDPPAASALAAALLNGDAVEVHRVVLQPATEDGQPDLALHLADGRLLFLEHKIEAALQPRQLERYLRHGLVALVSRRSLAVPELVLTHDDYLRPPRREYFTWQDIFRALPLPDDSSPGRAALREAFRSYMRELGFAPTNLARKWRRLFEDRTEKENRQVQADFGRLLDGSRKRLRTGYGLSVNNVSHKGKRAKAPKGANWRHLYVHPLRLRSEIVPGPIRQAFEPGYEALAVEVVYDEDQVPEAHQLLESLPAVFEAPDGYRWYRIGVYPISRDRLRVSLATPLPPFFEEDGGLTQRVHAAATRALDVVLAKLGVSFQAGRG